MPNQPYPEDLLSAYLDGEAAPEERAHVERLLEHSPEARDELEEMRAVSELLKSLPQDGAPAELAPSVMQRAERESLLPASPADDASVAPASRTGPSRRRSWMVVAAGVLTTAVALLMMVWILPDGPAERGPSMTESDFEDRGESQLAARSERDAAAREPGSAEEHASAAAEPHVAAARDESETEAAPASPAPLVADRDGAVEAEARRPAADAVPARARNAAKLRAAQRGDVIRYLEPSGERLKTYRVTVVDVEQAVDRLQFLLARNSIPRVSPRDANEESFSGAAPRRRKDEDSAADHSKAKGDKKGRLFAVYVETTPERFAAALRDLRQHRTFADLEGNPAIEEDRVQVAAADRERALFRAAQSKAAPNAADDAGVPSGRAATAPVPGKALAAKRGSGKSASSGFAPAVAAAEEADQAKAADKTDPETSKPPADAKPGAKRPAEGRSAGRPELAASPAQADNRTALAARGPRGGSFQMRVLVTPAEAEGRETQRRENLATAQRKAAKEPAEKPSRLKKNGDDRKQDAPPAGERVRRRSDDAAPPAPAKPIRVLFVFRQSPEGPKPK